MTATRCKAGQRAQDRRLAGSGFADQPEHFSFADMKARLAHCVDVTGFRPEAAVRALTSIMVTLLSIT
jgi:hypothetical protein